MKSPNEPPFPELQMQYNHAAVQARLLCLLCGALLA